MLVIVMLFLDLTSIGNREELVPLYFILRLLIATLSAVILIVEELPAKKTVGNIVGMQEA